MKSLTPRQQRIYDFIKSEVLKKGYPPSVREIGEAVGLRSSSTVHAHLEKLEAKGYIRRDATKPRAIEITDPDFNQPTATTMVALPLVGRVTAGEPILAQENVDEYVDVPAGFIKQGSAQFVLKVQGDSMMNAGILDGDMVVVRQQNTADNGEIIVALLEDEATVKRLFIERDHYRLQPENPAYEPILTDSLTVLGKVTAVFRVMD
ncbi:MAG: transcriptional repressor LexA [Firmicutes bacterium]|nr:transcriptional repressor LexA [Bacillota bacterium]